MYLKDKFNFYKYVIVTGKYHINNFRFFGIYLNNKKTQANATHLVNMTKKGSTYRIKQADTFWTLSEKYPDYLNEVLKMNPTIDPYNLKVGQLIRLP